MLRYKALKILKAFNEEDVKKFTLFLESPYFNHSKKVARLYKILKQFHPDYSSQKFTNRYLKKKIGTKSDSTLKNLFADFYPLCEKYLSCNNFLNDGFEFDIQLISALNSKNLESTCLENISKVKDKIESEKEFHTVHLSYYFQLSNFQYNIEMFSKAVKKKSDLDDHLEHYTNSHDYIFYFYFLNSLNAYIMMLNICKLTNQNPKETKLGKFFDTFFPIDKINLLLHTPYALKNEFLRDIFEIKWLYVLIRLDKDMFKHSKRFIDLLKKHSTKLHIDEKYNFYKVFSIWYPSVIQQKDFEEYEFNFYDNLLEQKAYKSSGHDYMTVRDFVMLIIRGVTTGRYKWTDNLIENCITILEPKYHLSVNSLKNVYLNILHNKDYVKALIHLNEIQHFNELKLKKEIKYLSIILYYELREYNITISKIEIFSKFLNNKEVPLQEKEIYCKFIKYIKILTLHRLEEKEIEPGEIKKQILKLDYFISKNWLLEKIDEMQKVK